MMEECDADFREEILADFNEHFEQGKMKGRSEEEIAASLGDVRELIEELKQEQHQRSEKKQKAKDSAEFRRVRVQGLTADVIVRPSQKDQVEYVLSDRGAQVNIHNYLIEETIHGDELLIEVKRRTHRLFNFDFANLILQVSLPQTLDSAVLQSVSGKVDLERIELAQLECKSTSGAIEVVDCSGDLKAVTVSGEITIQKHDGGRLELSTTSGDIEIQGNDFTMIRMNSLSGDIEVDCQHAEMIQMNSLSGDLQFQGAAKNISGNTKSGDVEISCEEAEAIKLESLSGDVELCLPDCTGMQCALKTLSGDVDIDLSQPYQFKRNYLIFGDESCVVSLKTLSGDITLRD